MKIAFGMSEVLVIGGVYLHSFAFGLSLTLMGLGLFGKMLALGMEKAAEDSKTEAANKSIKTVVDTIVGAVTSAVDGDVKSSRSKSGTFH
jgi:hypothetical protein